MCTNMTDMDMYCVHKQLGHSNTFIEDKYSIPRATWKANDTRCLYDNEALESSRTGCWKYPVDNTSGIRCCRNSRKLPFDANSTIISTGPEYIIQNTNNTDYRFLLFVCYRYNTMIISDGLSQGMQADLSTPPSVTNVTLVVMSSHW